MNTEQIGRWNQRETGEDREREGGGREGEGRRDGGRER